MSDLNKDEWREASMEYGTAVDWFEEFIIPQIMPELFWEISKFEVDVDGNVKASRRRGRPRGSKDKQPRVRRWPVRPDENAIIQGVVSNDDGSLSVVSKRVGDIAQRMSDRLNESDVVVQDKPVAPLEQTPLSGVGKHAGPVDEVSTPVVGSAMPKLRFNVGGQS